MLSRVYSSNLARPERRFSRHLIGDFTFALQVSQTRQKIVLERNIAQILDHHQKRCTQTTNSDTSAKVTTTVAQRPNTATSEALAGLSVNDASEPTVGVSSSNPHPEEPSASHWTLSNMSRSAQSSVPNGGQEATERKTRRSLRGFSDKVYEEPDAELTLDLSNIRKKLNFKTNAQDSGERSAKRQKRDTIKCQCYLTVWDNRDGYNVAPLVSRSEYCFVTPRETESNGYFVDVELEKQFSIRASELKVSILVNNEETFALIDKYFLELKIIPCRSDSRWPPVPLLGKSDGDHFAADIKRNGAEVLQGAVVARYTHLPQAPDADTPLSVFFLHEGRTYRTKYGLQVDAIWQKSSSGSKTLRRRPEGLDLDQFRTPDQKASKPNQEAKVLEPERSAPTTGKQSMNGTNGSLLSELHNGAKKDKNGATITPEVCYDFCSNVDQKFRYATVKGYRCPLCAVWKTPRLDRLVFHLSTMHAKYIFQVQKPQRDPISKELTHIHIKVDPAPFVKKREEHLIDWEAPSQPFNLSAYAKGDRDWVSSTEDKKNSPEASKASLQSTQHSLAFPPSPAAVPDFRKPKRKRFKAIRLQSKNGEPELVHTSLSHRPISPSEDARSETDDEIDNEWQVELHMERLDFEGRRSGWTDCERSFYKRWDRHRMEEQLEHSRYLSNSLVRFVRKYRAWLKNGDDELLQVFFEFLGRLKERTIIEDDVVCEVNALIFRASPAPAPPPSGESSKKAGHNRTSRSRTPTRRSGRHLKADNAPPRNEGGHADNRVVVTEVGHQEELQSTTKRELMCGHCLTPVPRARKSAVYCVDPECETPGTTYHINCAEESAGLKANQGRMRKGKRKANHNHDDDPATEPGAAFVTGLAAQDRTRLNLSTWCCQSCTKRQKASRGEKEHGASVLAEEAEAGAGPAHVGT
ncbi:hypothetical protein PV08_02976 [Exophiala spinifera]|uniref:Polycomb protein VEFS-Box domain-containing protein n=1 Tax=Exophiala spinifera TaxID=91928 RepID=A0A0D2A133_9EURO|nr:uncharacterized protein PV08_02976 [Exophiala spinifera]KIW18687.1 hypothetical protein PV08_02976 [Exophiala spinifera]